jgi:hypothetical protein
MPIAEIYPNVMRVLAQTEAGNGSADVRGLGLGWPILGGQVACLKAEERIAIAGLLDVMRVFDEIENGRLKDIQYIECHSCPTACVGGSLNVENPYIARGRVLRMVEKYGAEPCQDRQKISELYQNNFFSLRGSIEPTPAHPLDDDISRAINKMHRRNQLHEMLPKIDCGACGAPTCMTFATDVVMGEATAEECIFVSLHTLEQRAKSLLGDIKHQTRNIRGGLEKDGHET